MGRCNSGDECYLFCDGQTCPYGVVLRGNGILTVECPSNCPKVYCDDFDIDGRSGITPSPTPDCKYTLPPTIPSDSVGSAPSPTVSGSNPSPTVIGDQSIANNFYFVFSFCVVHLYIFF